MGEKFVPNQLTENTEASTHERAEVLSPLGEAFLQHCLNEVEGPDLKAQCESSWRRRIAALGQEELERHLGFQAEKRGAIKRLLTNKYFIIGTFAIGLVEFGYCGGKKFGEHLENSREPEVTGLTDLDPTMTPERMRRLLEAMPKGFSSNVDRYGHRSKNKEVDSHYGLKKGTLTAGVAERLPGQSKTSIYFYPPSVEGKRLADASTWFGVAAHETFHAVDDVRSTTMAEADRQTLRAKLMERVQAGNRFKSSYVESIQGPVDTEKDPAKLAEAKIDYRATEYLAELGEAYLISADPEKEFAPEDLELIRWVISLKDPNFDQKAARAQHLEVLREMQKQHEDWDQAGLVSDFEGVRLMMRGLPLSPDEVAYVENKLMGQSLGETGNSSEMPDPSVRAGRHKLVESLKRWGTTKERQDWAWNLLNFYDDVDGLRQMFDRVDNHRPSEILAQASLTTRDASHIGVPPEGATDLEAEAFRVEVLGLLSAGVRLNAKLEPGEYAELLDWSADSPAWTVNGAGFGAAQSDKALENKIAARNRANNPSWMLDGEQM